MSKLTLEDAISHCLEVAEQNETSAITYKNCKEIKANMYEKLTAEKAENDCRECATEHRQLAEWLTELKELRKLTVINPIIAGYNEVYEKLIKGDIEASNDKELLKTAVGTLENVMPKYRRLSEENQKQKEQIAEYKRLLKAAVEDFKWLEQHTEDDYGSCMVKTGNLSCGNCPFNTNGVDCKWKHGAEALKLIGGSENGT
jgi:hypothetical protein